MRKSKVLIFAVVFILFSSLFAVSAENQKTSTYAVIPLSGTVNPVLSEFIVESIDKAQNEGASFVILTIDTPGGLIGSMRDIIKAILTAKIPVITYTYPKGAQAASAGGFIMIAGHVNAMSPGTEIGAMHPVSPFVDFGKITGGEESKKVGEEVMATKILNDTVAYGKSIAEKRNRNVEWTEKAIREAVSATYSEAVKLKIIDIIAEDIPDLLRQLNGRKIDLNGKEFVFETKDAAAADFAMNWKERMLNALADPQVVFLLFIIAVVGIIIEIKNPGMIVPGTIGALSLFLFLMTVRILPINIAGLLLIVLSIVLFILELKYVSYGLLTLGGLVSFICGSLILFDSNLPGFSVPITSILSAVFIIILFVFGILRVVIRTHKGKVTTGSEGMIGETGTAANTINVRGKIHVHGELWNAVSDEPIEKGEKVVIVSVEGITAHVKKAE